MQILFADPGVGRMDAKVVAVAGAEEEDAEADRLADRRGGGGALYAHPEDVDEERIKAHVQNSAADDADHRIEGVALEPELVVDCKGRGHKGGGDKDPAQILDRGRDQPLVLPGRTEEFRNRLQKDFARQRKQQAKSCSQNEARGGHLVGLARVLFAEGTGDVVCGALADEKAGGLNQGHDGQGD